MFKSTKRPDEATSPVAPHPLQPEECYLINENTFSEEDYKTKYLSGIIEYVRFLSDKKTSKVKDSALSRSDVQRLKNSVIPALEGGARIGHPTSLYDLADIYEALEEPTIAYNFYLLALEEGWLRGIKVHEELKTSGFWEQLKKKLPRRFQKIQKTVKGISALYVPSYANEYIQEWAYQPFAETFYLTSGDHYLRSIRFKAKFYEKEQGADPWGMAAVISIHDDRYDIGIRCCEQSGKPSSLYNIGILYQDGSYGTIEGRPNYEKAKEYFQRSGTSDAKLALGYLYHHKNLIADDPYEVAAHYYEASEMPSGWTNLATLYSDGMLKGGANYEKAAEYCIKLKSPQGWCKLAVLYADGHIKAPDGQSNYEEAKKYYLRSLNLTEKTFNLETLRSIQFQEEQSIERAVLHNLGNLYWHGYLSEGDRYIKAQLCYEKSSMPGSLTALGALYMNGAAEGGTDYVRAADYFRRANTSQSLKFLGSLHQRGLINGSINYKEAEKCYQASSDPESKLHLLEIYRSSERKQAIDLSTINKIKDDFFKALKELDPPTNQLNYLLGGFYLGERDYEKSYLYFMESFLHGYSEAEVFVKHLTNIFYLSNNLEKAKKTVETIPEEEEEEESTPSLLASESQPKQEEPVTELESVVSEKETSSEEESTSDSDESLEVDPETLEKEIAESIQRAKSDFKSFRFPSPAAPTVSDVPLTIKFIDSRVNRQYDALLGDKALQHQLEELIDDIQKKPWTSEGKGRPELLKNVFKGIKGCISRRLDKKNRLVYKVTAPHEITIISCKGHYT